MKKAITIKEGVIFKGDDQFGTFNAETGIVLTAKKVAPPDRKAILALLPEGTQAVFDVAPLNADHEEKPKVEERPKAAKKDIPEAPEQDPKLGDRSPGYAAWLKEHHPDQFAEQFRNRPDPLAE